MSSTGLINPDTEGQTQYDDDLANVEALEKRFQAPSTAPGESGSDIARQKEVDGLQAMFDGPDAGESGSAKIGTRPPDSEESTEQQSDDTLGRGHTSDGTSQRRSSKIRSWTRKHARGLGVTAALSVSGSAILVSIFGAPLLGGLHLLHWGELLQGINLQNEIHNRSKISKLYRYMRLQGSGTTRLGVLSTAAEPKLLTKLTKSGYRLIPSTTTGQMRGMIIDPSKAEEFKGKSTAEIKKTLSERYGIPESKIGGNANGGTIRINLSDLPIKSQELVLRDTAILKRSGEKTSAISLRVLRKYFNVPSIFHPFDRASAALDRKFESALDRNKMLKEIREKRRAKIIERENAGKLTWKSLKNNVNSVAGKVGGAVMLQGFMCAIRDNADLINNIQRDLIIVPGMLKAAEAMAMADQIKDGTDTTSLIIESAVAGLYNDKGFSVFDGRAASILAGKTDAPSSLATEEYNSDYSSVQTAFSGNTQFKAVVDFIDNNLAGGTVCSPIAQLTGAVAGILLLATGSGGVASKGMSFILSASISFAVGKATLGAIEYYANQTVLDITEGPLEGDTAVHGQVRAKSMAAMNAGGSVLDDQQTVGLANEIAYEKSQAQAQKSIASRIFDPYDSTSVAGRIIDSTSPSATKNFASLVGSFTSIGKSAVSMPLRLFGASASAADGQTIDQKLGMQTISEQPAILAINDPYANADAAAKLLDANPAAYQDRARVCYGAEIVKATDSDGNSYWDVNYVAEPDITSTNYSDKKCNDVTSSVSVNKDTTKDTSTQPKKTGIIGFLQRIGSFIASPFTSKAYAAPATTTYHLNDWGVVTGMVSYTHTMESLVCAETYDDDSCAKLGMGGNVSTLPESPASPDTSGATGPATLSRAQGSWGGYKNGNIPLSALTNISNITASDGTKASFGGCVTWMSQPYLHPSAAVSIVELNKTYKQTFGKDLKFLSCYRDYDQQVAARKKYGSDAATPGRSNHGWGLAVDFDDMSSYSLKEYRWLLENASKYGWVNPKNMQQGGSGPHEPWHWEYARPVSSGGTSS